jgi:rod shape-determining protein MreC
VDIISEYFSIVDENEKLLLENQKLKQERENILFLIQENQQLAKMLNYKYPPAVNSVTAKIVADSESAFAQSLIVLAGSNSGVEKGDVVMANGALMGRVINVASDAAQVLLLNDVNSRIPVFVGKDRQRAILVGDNTNSPVLILFLQEDKIAVGDEITTSGDAGVFPSGLIIGTVDEVGDDEAKVSLVVDRDKVDYVKILNFGQRGILQSTDKWTK